MRGRYVECNTAKDIPPQAINIHSSFWSNPNGPDETTELWQDDETGEVYEQIVFERPDGRVRNAAYQISRWEPDIMEYEGRGDAILNESPKGESI